MNEPDAPEPAAPRRKPGTRPFWLVVAGIVVWIGLGVWLDHALGWPDRYGFHCAGRGCLFEGLRYSPRLIAHGHGHAEEWALFAWYWLMVPLPFIPLLQLLVKKRPRLTIFESAPKD